MSIEADAGADIRVSLRRDHARVLGLAWRALQHGAPPAPAVHALRDEVECHRRADERVIAPVLLSVCPAGPDVARQRTSTLRHCASLIGAIEADRHHLRRRALTQLLLSALVRHARDDHRSVMPVLSHRLSVGLREELAGAYRRARQDAAVALA